MKKLAFTAAAALLCSTAAIAQDNADPQGNAMAQMINADGEEVGVLQFGQTDEGLHIWGEVTADMQEGPHGVHIHETGECDPAGGFESAGGHFNPNDNQHGLENPEGQHAGDLPNQIANVDGLLQVEVLNPDVSLVEGEDGYLFDEDGSAIVVHANEDDQMTDPGGNSGDRIACGVIEPLGDTATNADGQTVNVEEEIADDAGNVAVDEDDFEEIDEMNDEEMEAPEVGESVEEPANG